MLSWQRQLVQLSSTSFVRSLSDFVINTKCCGSEGVGEGRGCWECRRLVGSNRWPRSTSHSENAQQAREHKKPWHASQATRPGAWDLGPETFMWVHPPPLWEGGGGGGRQRVGCHLDNGCRWVALAALHSLPCPFDGTHRESTMSTWQ